MIIDTEDPKRGLTDYEHRLCDELERKGRQLKEARRLLRDALFALPRDYHLTRAGIECGLKKLDDRSAKKRRRKP